MLIDAIVGAILLGVALASLVALGGRAISAQGEGEHLRNAAMLIDERLNLVLMAGVEGYTSRYDLEGTCDPPFGQYRYRVQIGGGQSGEPYSVAVTVSWMAGGRSRSETVEALIAPLTGDDPDPIRRPGTVVDRLQ
jgi:hypothetical protein